MYSKFLCLYALRYAWMTFLLNEKMKLVIRQQNIGNNKIAL